MEIDSENVDSNYAQSVLLEHDYTDVFFHNNNNNSETVNKVNNRLESDKKFHEAFKTVDKWADSVILRLPTGDDRRKIVDREITIHKVKYPFLPEQQIRGKVYKKFGIPTVMGGLLSRRKDQKKMADTKKWHLMQEFPEKEEKFDLGIRNSISGIPENETEFKSEVTTTESLDQVSISSQPTQIAPFVIFDATKSSTENSKFPNAQRISKESISGSALTVNLQGTTFEDLPTQKYERNWKKTLLTRDINANLSPADIPQSEKAHGKKRKINVSPTTKGLEETKKCKKMKISGQNNRETTWRKTNQPEVENSQDHDVVTLEHSYSSGSKKKSQKLPPFSKIARKSGQFSTENGKYMKKEEFEDEENGENRHCQKDDGDVIILDEFTGLGKNIVLSPIVLSPVQKLTIYPPEFVEISSRKPTLRNPSKYSRLCGNSSKTETVPKLRDLTNFVGPKMCETPTDSEAVICPASSSPRRPTDRVSFASDSLSNRCCEYDRDMREISKLCNTANYFHNLELMSKNDLKVDKNRDEFEMREKVDEILQNLEREPL